jgi:putative sterol carrier protein
VAAGDTKKPEFVIAGTLDTYRQIFTKKLDPIQALMGRKLKLEGNMMKIMRSVKATLDLVNCCSLIDTVYVDGKK